MLWSPVWRHTFRGHNNMPSAISASKQYCHIKQIISQRIFLNKGIFFTCASFTATRNSKFFTSLWVPGTHRSWFLWVPEHWEWVPSLMFLFVGNFKMCPGDESLLSFNGYMTQDAAISESLHNRSTLKQAQAWSWFGMIRIYGTLLALTSNL